MPEPLHTSSFTHQGTEYPVAWYETDSFDDMQHANCTQICAVAYKSDNELILVRNQKGKLNLPGGTIEQGETIEQALHRELQEETNTRVIKWLPIGYQIVTTPVATREWQFRVVAIIEPHGAFEYDPSGDIVENVLITPQALNQHIQHGYIGTRFQRVAEEKYLTMCV